MEDANININKKKIKKEKILSSAEIAKVEEKKLKQLSKTTVSKTELVNSLRSLSIMMKASIPLSEAISILSGQVVDQKLQSVLKQIHIDLINGEKLSDAMKKYPKVFPVVVVSLVYSGEYAESLEKNLKFLSLFLQKQYELEKKVKSAFIYPLIILGMAFAEVILMIFFVFPKLDSLFESFPNVPATTKMLVAGAGYIRTNWYYFGAGVLVLGIILSQVLKTKKGKRFLDWLQLNFPIMKRLYISSILSSFSRTLGLLLKSGIHISKAVKITASALNNSIYTDYINEVYENVKLGHKISSSLSKNEKLFNRSYVKMIEVGEQTGTLEESLMYMYKYYDNEVGEIANNIVTFMEPLLLILVGVVIAFVGLSVILPMYQFIGSING
ncbi:MAG TPA: type II secretion system F family protein [Candidatus Dojkabacteria bacterium]|nr:type II secretion system F family protein [Candidatus Dojkabacteria bacterium]HQF36837.1 type II secretion system F family protein [Candidatus Dojkabacteria bacterium]